MRPEWENYNIEIKDAKWSAMETKGCLKKKTFLTEAFTF